MAQKFSKQQLLGAARYRDRRDMLSALLEDGKLYTHDAVEALIKKFEKGQVK